MPAETIPAQHHEQALRTGTQSQRYRTCITQVLRDGEITAPIRRTRSEIFRVHVGVGAHSLSITCLRFYIIPKRFLLLTMNVPRPRAALTGQYYVLTWFLRAHAEHLRRYFFHTGAPGDNRFSRRESRLCQSSRQYVLCGIDAPCIFDM